MAEVFAQDISTAALIGARVELDATPKKKKGAMGAGELVMGRMGLSELGPAAKQSADKMDARDMK